MSNYRLDDWLYGPTFDVHFAFKRPVLMSTSPADSQAILEKLGIEGTWANESSVGDLDSRQTNWSEQAISYGLWTLLPGKTIGVKILPCRPDGAGGLLACPPAMVNTVFGPYPWVLESGWVTAAVIELHDAIISKCRALHTSCELRAILLQDEAWTLSIPADLSGICVHPEIARVAGYKGSEVGRLFVIPF